MRLCVQLPIGAAAALLLVLSAVGDAGAAEFDGLFYGTNDFGGVGLLQTPTARMRPDGEFGLGIATVRPYNQIHFFLQLLPYLETTVRYTDVTNRFYSTDPNFSGTQHYKDKSADFKLRLLDEGQYRPSVAFGIQDIGGTGLFSTEYVVSNYHYYDLDFSFGLAWGRLGSRGGIRNPLSLISHHFDKDRYNSPEAAGSVSFSNYFTGHNIGPFGGVEWKTPLKGLDLRVEYDGNDYQHEGLGDNQKQNSPINVGLAYRGLDGLDMGVGWERGNRVEARLAIYTDFQSLRGVAKTADPVPLRLPPAAAAPEQHAAAPAATVGGASSDAQAGSAVANGFRLQLSTSLGAAGGGAPAADSGEVSRAQKDAFVLKLRQVMKEQGFTLIGVDIEDDIGEVRVWLNQERFRNPAKAVGRIARVLSTIAPQSINRFVIANVEQGMETYRASVQRADFELAARGEAEPDVALSALSLSGPRKGYNHAEYLDDTWLPRFSWDTGPAVRQSVGGPQGFYFGQLYWKLAGTLALSDRLQLTAAAGFNIVNNFNNITLQSNSTLPHVRSDVVKYLQQGKDGIINLESDYHWSPYPDWYSRFSAGIFEEMYGGLATEFLYRPYGRSWAVALDVNRVRQRGYDEMFDFLPYMVTTGHMSFYWEPDFHHLLFKVSAGQYLARDRGATIDVSREFDSGVRCGIFATKTNVSSAQFGEGSFDKGLYIVVPLDLFFAQSTRREAAFAFRPLTRDGGQMVYDGPELYFTVHDGQPSDFVRGADELLK
ncbi:MAG: YjbH domain-containing protein [Nevskia sp.]|nr:YjbH domain-containing protein [Nevskia sp.]